MNFFLKPDYSWSTCAALLTVLARKGYFKDSFADDTMSNCRKSDYTQAYSESSLLSLFADAVKGPLLSSDTQVQIGALDLILHSLSPAIDFFREIGALLEKGIADYVFEILRLAGQLNLESAYRFAIAVCVAY